MILLILPFQVTTVFAMFGEVTIVKIET